MKIFKPQNANVKDLIRNVDDRIIQNLIKYCLKIKENDEYGTIYSTFYESQYPLKDFSISEQRLEEYINHKASESSSNVKTKVQGKEYRWVTINEENVGQTAFRYYFAPNPSNMYGIVRILTSQLSEKKIPVEFKYQLKGKMNECDRIILYSDSEHQHDIEQIISNIYLQNPELFTGSERALPWIYESKIPHVYLAPETPGSSYGEKFARTMIDAKQIFCYLYGLTTNNHLKLSGEKAKEALIYMEQIICSLMLEHGLLLSKDNRIIVFKDKPLTYYNYKTGVLNRSCTDSNGYHHSVEYSQSLDGKKALLNNFYNISKMQSQKGIQVKHLTPQERKRELYEVFGWYADEFKDTSAKIPR